MVRMHTTVWFLTDALKALMNDPPPPVEVQGSDSAASTIDATASVATEDMKAACASGRTAMQAAARLAEVVVSACDHSAGVAKNSAATRLDSAEKLEAVYESLQELLSIICRLLDATKQKLGAVQAMRDEQWALNQLRLVRVICYAAYHAAYVALVLHCVRTNRRGVHDESSTVTVLCVLMRMRLLPCTHLVGGRACGKCRAYCRPLRPAKAKPGHGD